jgi:hypothetical protein
MRQITKLTHMPRNTGTTNSFTPVDISNLSGGLYNSGTLLEGNHLACFVYQLSAQAKPDILTGPLTQLQGALGQVTANLACPGLQAIDDSQLRAFPGYSKNPVYAK